MPFLTPENRRTGEPAPLPLGFYLGPERSEGMSNPATLLRSPSLNGRRSLSTAQALLHVDRVAHLLEAHLREPGVSVANGNALGAGLGHLHVVDPLTSPGSLR